MLLSSGPCAFGNRKSMARTVYPIELNKGFSSKIPMYISPEYGWSILWLKHCEYDYKDDDNSLNNGNSVNKYLHGFIIFLL